MYLDKEIINESMRFVPTPGQRTHPLPLQLDVCFLVSQPRFRCPKPFTSAEESLEVVLSISKSGGILTKRLVALNPARVSTERICNASQVCHKFQAIHFPRKIVVRSFADVSHE